MLGNLKCLRSLKKLNLAMNLIEVLQNTLDDLNCLEELNLSGNKICRIEEILMLKKIPNLKVLSFFDPHFGENPICKIYNYQVINIFQSSL
jgi:Leucine-rich repeat (LRR) protein